MLLCAKDEGLLICDFREVPKIPPSYYDLMKLAFFYGRGPLAHSILSAKYQCGFAGLNMGDVSFLTPSLY